MYRHFIQQEINPISIQRPNIRKMKHSYRSFLGTEAPVVFHPTARCTSDLTEGKKEWQHAPFRANHASIPLSGVKLDRHRWPSRTCNAGASTRRKWPTTKTTRVVRLGGSIAGPESRNDDLVETEVDSLEQFCISSVQLIDRFEACLFSCRIVRILSVCKLFVLSVDEQNFVG
ncbi:hypothetical protein CEXT_157361 [Caerostris extrusa]|uniref:Uncharacterized protein n=1 Tax=Caerostris extrusa TaxID=172846 RepID=A0AAV4NE72_CAEEX|nr:hypothetical protein CEXT_157361 [Caerostris extrusa]